MRVINRGVVGIQEGSRGASRERLLQGRQASMFFAEGLDLGLFDPFKDMRDSELLDEEEITAPEKNVGKEENVRVNI